MDGKRGGLMMPSPFEGDACYRVAGPSPGTSKNRQALHAEGMPAPACAACTWGEGGGVRL